MGEQCPFCDREFSNARGLGVHKSKKHDDEVAWNDEERLRSLYHDEGYSMQEVADEIGCAINTIQRAFDKFDIESRRAPQEATHPPHHGFQKQPDRGVGSTYEIVATEIDGRVWSVPVHRLVAVAEGLLKPSELWDQRIDIHHKNEHGLDNRPENLQRLTKAEHAKEHKPWRDSHG